MRIVGGKYKGRVLVSFKADHIRPTTDRVKESLFNILQGYVDEARVLDLFSGTGNLSFESLSRGARSVDAVELNRKSIAIIKQNQALLKVGKELTIYGQDALKYLSKYSGPPYDLIFADPPFTEKLAHSVLEALVRTEALGPDSWVAIEASAHERADDSYSHGDRTLSCVDRRDYGDKSLLLFRQV